jgi:hypothetical protein
MSKKRVRQACRERGCEQRRVSLGRCSEHFAKLKLDSLAFLRLKRMSPAERELVAYAATSRGERPKAWEFEPTPEQTAELIEQYGEKK